MSNGLSLLSVALPKVWASSPEWMSFSFAQDAGECPRRAALRRSEYPEIWQGHGYPPSYSFAAAKGTIVHEALAKISRELAKGSNSRFCSVTPGNAPFFFFFCCTHRSYPSSSPPAPQPAGTRQPIVDHVGPVHGVAVIEVGEAPDGGEPLDPADVWGNGIEVAAKWCQEDLVEVLIDQLEQWPHGALGGRGRSPGPVRTPEQSPRPSTCPGRGTSRWRTRRRRGRPPCRGESTGAGRAIAPHPWSARKPPRTP